MAQDDDTRTMISITLTKSEKTTLALMLSLAASFALFGGLMVGDVFVSDATTRELGWWFVFLASLFAHFPLLHCPFYVQRIVGLFVALGWVVLCIMWLDPVSPLEHFQLLGINILLAYGAIAILLLEDDLKVFYFYLFFTLYCAGCSVVGLLVVLGIGQLVSSPIVGGIMVVWYGLVALTSISAL